MCVHAQLCKSERRSDLCGPNCTSLAHNWANLASVFSTDWIGRWGYCNPLSTSLLPHGPLFLIMGCGIYCCAIFSYCPSTAVNASLIFISVYLKQQHAVVVVVVVFPAQVVLYISVTTEVCLPLQVCALVLCSSTPLCSLSVTHSLVPAGILLELKNVWRQRHDNINQMQH